MKNLTKTLVAATTALSLIVCAAAAATNDEIKIDMNAFSCADFLSGNWDPIMIAAWIDGYLAFHYNETRVRLSFFEEIDSYLNSHCQAAPNEPVLDAVLAALSTD